MSIGHELNRNKQLLITMVIQIIKDTVFVKSSKAQIKKISWGQILGRETLGWFLPKNRTLSLRTGRGDVKNRTLEQQQEFSYF